MKNYEGKTVLITGGTGTFGKYYTKFLLDNCNPGKVIILSRDEMKQYDMQKYFSDNRLRFFLGDVRDLDRLRIAFRGVDYLIHAAATKILMSAETNPFECIKITLMVQ